MTPEGGANGRPLFNPIRGCRVVVRVIPGLRPGLLKLDPVPGSPECHLNRLRDALGSPSAGSVLIPGLSTRAALSGRFQWGARFPGRRHAFRVTPPGLFSVALSGLKEWGTRCCRVGAAHRIPLVGAAPRGCPPVRTGTRCRVACELSPEGTKENSPGFQPGDSRRAQIESRRDDRIRIGSQMYLGSHSIPCRLRNVNNSSLPVL